MNHLNQGTNEGLGHGTSIQVTWRGSTFKQGKTNLVSSGATWHLCIEIKGKIIITIINK